MVLHRQSIKPIPSLTQKIARKAFPKGNLYMSLRDKLGTFYDDNDFAELYSSEGQPALRPGNLALICVMQYMANLSDRGAVQALAARIDWKYALGLELSDPGFDSSVLSLFRSRLLNGKKEKLILDKLLECCQQLKLIKSKGKARTDSTHILAAIRNPPIRVNKVVFPEPDEPFKINISPELRVKSILNKTCFINDLFPKKWSRFLILTTGSIVDN